MPAIEKCQIGVGHTDWMSGEFNGKTKLNCDQLKVSALSFSIFHSVDVLKQLFHVKGQNFKCDPISANKSASGMTAQCLLRGRALLHLSEVERCVFFVYQSVNSAQKLKRAH